MAKLLVKQPSQPANTFKVIWQQEIPKKLFKNHTIIPVEGCVAVVVYKDGQKQTVYPYAPAKAKLTDDDKLYGVSLNFEDYSQNYSHEHAFEAGSFNFEREIKGRKITAPGVTVMCSAQYSLTVYDPEKVFNSYYAHVTDVNHPYTYETELVRNVIKGTEKLKPALSTEICTAISDGLRAIFGRALNDPSLRTKDGNLIYPINEEILRDNIRKATANCQTQDGNNFQIDTVNNGISIRIPYEGLSICNYIGADHIQDMMNLVSDHNANTILMDLDTDAALDIMERDRKLAEKQQEILITLTENEAIKKAALQDGEE